MPGPVLRCASGSLGVQRLNLSENIQHSSASSGNPDIVLQLWLF